jgi:voltage-gated potassium channel
MTFVADVPWMFRAVIRRIGQTSTIAVVIALLILSVLIGAGAVASVEIMAGGSGPRNYFDALWWFIVTITGLGLNAIGPVSQAGRATSAVVLMLARIFFGMLTGAIAASLINRLLMEGKGMGKVALRRHCVICGWNTKGAEIVKQLVSDERQQEIVILCELENAPVRRSGVHFVHGDPTNSDDLRRASAEKADTVIILADESYQGHSDTTMDARSVLTALAVETVNQAVYTFVEVRQPQNKQHFEHARVDEMLVADDIVADLMSRASILHGLTRVVGDLLAIGTGSEIYIIPTPQSLAGMAFDDALITLQSRKRCVLIGVDRRGETILTPQEPLIIEPSDSLIVISREAVVMD